MSDRPEDHPGEGQDDAPDHAPDDERGDDGDHQPGGWHRGWRHGRRGWPGHRGGWPGGAHGGRHSRPPPWWPQGEPWPPERPPWHGAPRRFRRRFVLAALALLGGLVAVGMLLSLLTGGWDRWRDDRPGGPPGDRQEQQDRGPGGLIVVVGGILVVGGIATALAYRRISRPVGDLLGAAGQVAEGDYDVRLRPDGPRELRMLTSTFNDMAVRLAATEEQRRRFLADVTHELRTPLAVLQSEVEAQLDGIHPRDDRHLGSLLEEIERLGRLVEDLHTLALAEAGRIVLHREPVPPGTLAEDAIEAHAAPARQKGVALRSAVASGLPEVDVDPNRVRQVLDNLLANAVRHTPTGGFVQVELQADAGGGEAVRFTVTDDGPGFPPDQLDQVFERFTRSADSRGSGLGLSIARDLVQAHGGTIRAGNDPGTGGATVGFTLPTT